ncbi:MAG: hypothetical protein JEZ05_00365 [Tenericutes bacterium]|nr:hypothetical protein [Mycoplasmatota bacterium]
MNSLGNPIWNDEDDGVSSLSDDGEMQVNCLETDTTCGNGGGSGASLADPTGCGILPALIIFIC